jgi:YVTN family beta-propeller protein
VSGGTVWVASSNDGSVTRIDAKSGTPRQVASVGQGAAGVATGFGSVWVTNAATGTVTRIDERTGNTLQPIQAGSGASAVAAGDGSVWVANSLDSTVSQIDPGTNTISATWPVGDGPNGVAVAPKTIWVSNELAGTLSRIAPGAGAVVKTAVRTGNRPEGLALSSGSLFVAVRASGVGHRGGTLRVLASAGSLLMHQPDPALAYGPQDIQIVTLTNDGLTTLRRVGGSNGYRLVPDLAVSVPAPTDGGRSYTFKLRPGLRYSTGAPVRPQDFRRALERALVQGYEGGYFSDVVGASGCLAAPNKPCSLARGIVADPAANTVTFHLSEPDPDFPYKLALNAADAVPVTTPLHPRGPLPATGPYRIASYNLKHGVRLVRNPRFHEWSPAAQPAGFPDEIVMRPGGSEDSRIAAVTRGSADIAVGGGPPPSPAALERLSE